MFRFKYKIYDFRHLDNNKLKYLPPDVFAVNNTLKKL